MPNTEHAGAGHASSPTNADGRSMSVRSRVVLGALLGSMTLVGGVLMIADDTPLPGTAGSSGLSLSPLMSLDSASGADARGSESIFDTNAPLDDRGWSSIVIHHSGSRSGTPEGIDRAHRQMGLAGLGYHFVIGNGSGMGDGELFRSPRWIEQQPGAHVAGPRGETLNTSSIGICLVGDGDRGEFTPAQLEQLGRLIQAMMDRFEIAGSAVMLHRDAALTSSPGRFFPEAAFRERFDPAG